MERTLLRKGKQLNLSQKGKRFKIYNTISCIIVLHNNLARACSISDIRNASVLHNNQWRKLHHIASMPYLLQLLLILIMQVRSFLLLKLSIGDSQGIFSSTRNGIFYKVCNGSVAHQLFVKIPSIVMYSLCHVSGFLLFVRAQYVALVFTKTASN